MCTPSDLSFTFFLHCLSQSLTLNCLRLSPPIGSQRWSWIWVLELTPAGFCVFLSYPESKIGEKPELDPGSLFNFGSCRSLRSHFLSENMGKFGLEQWLPESEQESDSQIKKNSVPGLKKLEPRAESESEKVTAATSAGSPFPRSVLLLSMLVVCKHLYSLMQYMPNNYVLLCCSVVPVIWTSTLQ